MNDFRDGEVRPFFACETCGLVYARLEEPQTCRLCAAALFIVVHPESIDR